MNEAIHEENEQDMLIFEITDDALESAAYRHDEKANTFTQWVCTALYFCPGPAPV